MVSGTQVSALHVAQFREGGDIDAKAIEHRARNARRQTACDRRRVVESLLKPHVLRADKLIVTPDIDAIDARCLLVAFFKKRDKSATFAVSSGEKRQVSSFRPSQRWPERCHQCQRNRAGVRGRCSSPCLAHRLTPRRRNGAIVIHTHRRALLVAANLPAPGLPRL